jgi:hypothetical protein
VGVGAGIDMTALKIIGAVLGVALAATSARAFDEQKKAPEDKSRAPAMETIKTPEGKELRLPGIGQIPKLDFGLELLYGQNKPQNPIPEKTEPGDLQIRATIKYRTN